MVRRIVVLAILVGALAPASAAAGVRLTSVGTFVAPTYITAPPGDTHRLFVVQQAGQIKLIKDGGAPSTFLAISSEVTYVGSEQGLLSIAFAPDYASSRRFFVYYTSKNCPQSPGCDEHVSEFTADSSGDTASASSEHVLLTIPHPNQENHNGGQLQFGPDGNLYISVGDGGGGNDTGHNAQRTDRLLGKILRISPASTSYTIPAGNPFNTGQGLCSGGSNGGSSCPEIWAYGLRNPWRFSFDRATGDLAIADVGQDRDEEIDYAHPGQNGGANYGWPCYEGSELNAAAASYSECNPLPSPVVSPVLAYPHPENCNGAPFCGEGIIGGYVMHDPALPSLDGCYVYGDLSNPRLRVTRLAQPAAVADADLGPSVSTLSTFGQDASGHLYAADLGDGFVYRLDEDSNHATDPSCQAAPATTTGAATNVGISSATLNGTVNPNGNATSYRFDYGTSSSYGQSTSPVAAGSGSSPVAASASITGLSAGTTYHYRIVALRNSTPAAFGSDHTFTTSAPAPPTVTTGTTTTVGTSTATLNGTVNPNGYATSYRFDYGTSSSYGQSTFPVAAGSGSSPVAASASITGLSAGTTYHYRIVALRNSTPAAFGSDHTFPTKSASTGSGNPAGSTPPAGNPPPTLTLTLLTLSPSKFKVARSGPSVVNKGKSGTLVRFQLSRGANVTFTVKRLRAGRKVNGRCVRVTPANRKARRCTLWSAIKGSFVIAGTPGMNAFRFTGRIRGHALAPGRYRLVAGVASPAGNRSKTVRFAIRRS